MRLRFGCVVLYLSALPVAAQQPSRPLWGSLEPGPHQIGFRQLLLRDATRPQLATTDRPALGEQPGRQLRVLLWYPAASGGTRLTYGDYIALLAQRLDFTPITAVRREAAIADFVARSRAMGGDTTALHAALPALLQTSVAATLNARPAAGRFPLVIFPEWRSPASNSIMAEYLTSHGFAVASVSLLGSYDDDVEWFAVRGIEALASDFAFVLSALDTVRYVDSRNAAAMGVGIAATGALALQMRTPAIRAFVSLEGGITTEGEQRLLMRTPLFDIGRVNVPMLAITAPHPSVDAARLDLYRYAPRRIVHFPTMGEFWFLDYGMLERTIPRIIGPPPGNTVLGFEWGARIVERFYSAHLKRDEDALRWLEALTPPAAAPQLFSVRVRPATPAPPSLAGFKRLIDSAGVSAISAFVAARLPTDSAPIPNEYFTNLNAWLGEGRDRSGAQRHELAALRVRMYPRSSRAHFALAASALRMRDSTSAREHVQHAMRLTSEDPDPLLDFPTRESIRRLGATLTPGAPAQAHADTSRVIVHQFTSQILGDTRAIRVYLPRG
ncbi:MAG: hypothetical protein AB1762_01870 [Gemmatimonadota bacterium]